MLRACDDAALRAPGGLCIHDNAAPAPADEVSSPFTQVGRLVLLLCFDELWLRSTTARDSTKMFMEFLGEKGDFHLPVLVLDPNDARPVNYVAMLPGDIVISLSTQKREDSRNRNENG